MLQIRKGQVMATLAVGSVGVAGYRKRHRLRLLALTTLAHGAPVILNARITEGTVDIDDSHNAILANSTVTAVDYSGLRKLSDALSRVLDAKTAEPCLSASSADGAHVLNSTFNGNGHAVGGKA